MNADYLLSGSEMSLLINPQNLTSTFQASLDLQLEPKVLNLTFVCPINFPNPRPPLTCLLLTCCLPRMPGPDSLGCCAASDGSSVVAPALAPVVAPAVAPEVACRVPCILQPVHTCIALVRTKL